MEFEPGGTDGRPFSISLGRDLLDWGLPLPAFMDAHLTNAITNALHAGFLLVYFVLAARARVRGDERFNSWVVGFFFLTFVLKMLGVFVHYSPTAQGVEEVWVAIGLGVILLNFLILQALSFPLGLRVAGVLFSVSCTVLFSLRQDFLFIAAEVLVINLAAALFSRGLLRVGFAGVVLANLFWVGARKGTEVVQGHALATEWRYDNDLYHFLLLASTFLIYKAFARGDGLPVDRPAAGAAGRTRCER